MSAQTTCSLISNFTNNSHSKLLTFPLKSLLELEKLPLFAVEMGLILVILHLRVLSLSWHAESTGRTDLSCMTQQKRAFDYTSLQNDTIPQQHGQGRHCRSLRTCAVFATGSYWSAHLHGFVVPPQHLVHLSKCTLPQGKLRKIQKLDIYIKKLVCECVY